MNAETSKKVFSLFDKSQWKDLSKKSTKLRKFGRKSSLGEETTNVKLTEEITENKSEQTNLQTTTQISHLPAEKSQKPIKLLVEDSDEETEKIQKQEQESEKIAEISMIANLFEHKKNPSMKISKYFRSTCNRC